MKKSEAIELMQFLVRGYRSLTECKEPDLNNIKMMQACQMAVDALKEQRPKGKWVNEQWVKISTGETRKVRKCSICDSGYFIYDLTENTEKEIPNYCPCCGADMRSKEVDDEISGNT